MATLAPPASARLHPPLTPPLTPPLARPLPPPPSASPPVAPVVAQSATGGDTSDVGRGAARRGPRRGLAVLLTIAVALAFADASVVALALPDLYAAFDTSIVGVSWVLTTYALVVAVVAIPVALLHRRLRPLRLTAAGIVVFVAASLLAGLASSLSMLLVARCLQGVGATFLLAGSLPALAGLLQSRTRARAWWATAAAVGAVAGPALGGVLTQLFDWRSIFLVQAPVVLLALAVVTSPVARSLHPDRDAPGRRFAQTIVPNLGFVLVFGALVAALFLGVLLAIEVWGYSPIEGALLVSALPAGMVLARPLASAPAVARGVGGALVLAGGLLGLAFLPGSNAGAAAVAFALCGAGFSLVSGVLGPAAMPDGAEVRDATASISFRHFGLVLGLVLIAPVLTASMDAGTDRATLGATRSLLEAQVPLNDKLPVVWDLRNAIEDAPRGQMPDLAKVFDENGAGSNRELAAARDGLTGTITDAITRSFRPAFAVAAGLAALAAVPALAVALRRRPHTAAARRRRSTALVLVGALGVAGVGLLASEQAAGASSVGEFEGVDPCTASPETYGGSGLDGWAQRVALSALNGAACDLHTTRERLVLSLDLNSGYNDVTWDRATAEKALHSGLQRAINDAEARGTMPDWGGSILGWVVDHAPLDWIVDRIPLFDN
jgi:MFS family permease